jgi:hypothetical protein
LKDAIECIRELIKERSDDLCDLLNFYCKHEIDFEEYCEIIEALNFYLKAITAQKKSLVNDWIHVPN